MADQPPTGKITCPVCRKLCKVPGGNNADNFPNNMFALHIIELNKTNNAHENTIKELNNFLQNGQ